MAGAHRKNDVRHDTRTGQVIRDIFGPLLPQAHDIPIFSIFGID
jgi:hypothetical protein